MTSWNDVVFLDMVGVEGKTLSEALADYANESEAHDIADEICHCVYCQVWVPMAMKLERTLAEARRILMESYTEEDATPLHEQLLSLLATR